MALDIVRIDKDSKNIRKAWIKKIEMENKQQKFVFPNPRYR